MSENNTKTTQTLPKATKKTSNKTWWIVGLAVFLIFTVAGSVFYTMNQKTSKSQASSTTATPKPKPGIPPIKDGNQVPPNRRPIPKQTTPATEKPPINPYTGEKQ